MNIKENEQKAENNEEKLFHRWINEQDEAAGNELVKKYIPLVNIIVEKIYKKLPTSVQKEELVSLGYIGLYEALKKFNPNLNLKFETYASFRIRGSILDGLRKEDWLPRTKRERTKKIETIIRSLEQKYLRKVTPEEIAKEAGITIDEVNTLLDENYYANVLSIDDKFQRNNDNEGSFDIHDVKSETPEERVIHTERIQELAASIKQLTEKEQLILSLHYTEGMTFTEIGQILDLSTSRISQLHSRTLKKLRTYLQPKTN